MGLLNVLKKIGKIGAIAAPIAASFIPGGSALAKFGGGIIGKVAGAGGGLSSMAGGGGSNSGGIAGGISSIGSRLGGLAGGIDAALHNGQDPMTRARVAGSGADALLKQRFDTAANTPHAIGADRIAFGNMMRAANVANYTPNPRAQELWAKFGQHALTPSAPAMQFGKTMQDELNRRASAGLPTTINGVAPAGAREMELNKKARQSGPGGVLGAVQTGGRLASLIPGIAGMFGGQKPPQGRIPMDEQYGGADDDEDYK